MVGDILIKIAFVGCLISTLSYFLHHRRRRPTLLSMGRFFYHTTVVLVLLTSATLLYLILTHQFQYTYVWSYSSRDLSTPLLISTFYAGQEGSFLLWALYTSLIGVFLLSYSSRKGYEPQVMMVYGLITSVLLLMLVVKSPFTYVWDTWPGDVARGFVPANGRGLNPLLQNYWMVIHPQVLFSGFACMAVPFAYALAGLIKRDYAAWVRPATPWMAFGALVLGTGIMLGGYWAYETLGWGGYWAWDPVENSSLVPWIFCVAALHSTLIQRKTGGFIRTNMILSMLAFITVLYSTFLTRSGVLGDTSVHSFVDPGMVVYWLLIGIIILFSGLGTVLLLRRWKEIPVPTTSHGYFSREFALFLGAVALVASAVLITAGTSSPIITDLLEGKKSAIDISYYEKTNLPLGIAIGLLAGIGQLLWWTRSEKSGLVRGLLWPGGLALTVTAALVAARVLSDVVLILFVLAALFALLANILVGVRIFKGNPKFAGGAAAHVGLAVMFLGFVASSEYDDSQTVPLTKGEPREALGYRLTYMGYTQTEGDRYAFPVRVEKDGRTTVVKPVMYQSTYNEGIMRHPDIVNLITRDFYLAPLSLETHEQQSSGSPQGSAFSPGETKQLAGLTLTFLGFNRPIIQEAALASQSDDAVTAIVMVGSGQELTRMELRKGKPLRVEGQGRLGRSYALALGQILAGDAADMPLAEIFVQNAGTGQGGGETTTKETLVVEVSVKPFINLVWAGVIILLVGLGVTIYRRAQEAAVKTSS